MVAESTIRAALADAGADADTIMHVLARHGLGVAELVDADWPYADLVLRCPHCPMCGELARMLVGTMVVPLAFCPNDDCAAWTWDPCKPAAELLANAVESPGFVPTEGTEDR